MDGLDKSQSLSSEGYNDLPFEIDAKPENSEHFTDKNIKESVEEYFDLADSTSHTSGIGSNISFSSNDDLHNEQYNWENVKHHKLRTSQSVPEFYNETLLDQERGNCVINITSATMCQFASGQGRNKLSTGEDNIAHNTVDSRKHVRDNTERILRDLKNTEPKVNTELLRYGKAKITRSKKLPLVIFKGSGCGCKFTAKILFQEELNKNEKLDGYCLTEPKQFSEVKLNQKSVVLILDACGGTKFDKHRLDEWHEKIRYFMPSAPSANSDITIIMTVQNFDEVNEHRLLKEYNTHVLDATLKKYRPSNETKKQMVKAIMKQHYYEIEPPLRDSSGSECSFLKKELINDISPLLGSIGYVRILNQFFRNATSEGITFFEKPIPEFVDRFQKDFEENKEFFLTLLSVYSHGGSMGFSDANNHKSIEETTKISEGNRLKLLRKFAKENGLLKVVYGAVERHAHEMEGQFLEESNSTFMFASKNVYNSFLVVLCERYSEAIEFCEEEFFFKFIKPVAGQEKREFLRVDGCSNTERLEAFMERLIRELLEGNVSKCMNHPSLSPQLFGRILPRLKRKRHFAWKVLNMQDKDKSAPFSCLVYGLDCVANIQNGNTISITDVIIKDGLWEKKRKKRKWCHWTETQENEAIIYAARLNREDTFKSLVGMGVEITLNCFYESIESPEKYVKSGKDDKPLGKGIIEEIIRRARFTQDQWLTVGHHLLQNYVGDKDEKRKPNFLMYLQSLLLNINLNSMDSTTEPFLHRVVRAGDIEAVKVLISDVAVKERLDIDLLWKRETALLIAAESGFAEIVNFLLQCGAKHRIRGLRMRPIWAATENNHKAVVQCLLAQQVY